MTITNINRFRSEEEFFFASYLMELFNNGLIEWFLYEPMTFNLYDGLYTQYRKKKKTVTRKCKYTPDFEVCFTDKARGILTFIDGDEPSIFFLKPNCNIVFFEVKGSFKMDADRDTITKIAWTQQSFNEIIHVVRPKELFELTFYPKLFLFPSSEEKARQCRRNNGLVPLHELVDNINTFLAKNTKHEDNNH